MEEKDKLEKDKLLEELIDLLDEILVDDFLGLYEDLEELQRQVDALEESFYRFCK